MICPLEECRDCGVGKQYRKTQDLSNGRPGRRPHGAWAKWNSSRKRAYGTWGARLVIPLNPPNSSEFFAKLGVCAIVAASCIPIFFGIVFRKVGKAPMFGSAVVGLVVHLGLYAWASWATSNGVSLNEVVAGSTFAFLFDEAMPQLGFMNPGVTATYGLIASAATALPACVLSLKRVRVQNPAPESSMNDDRRSARMAA